jgi:Domain of unknown function (DUF3850)
MNRVHELKVWPPYFDQIAAGVKTFDVRRNDRGFQVGDVLILHEWNPEQPDKIDYGFRQIRALVVNMLRLNEPPISEPGSDLVVLGLRVLDGPKSPT